MSYEKTLKDQQTRIAVDMQNIVNNCEKENRGLTVEEKAAWAKLEADHSALEDSIKIAAKTELSKVHESIADKAMSPVLQPWSKDEIQTIQDSYRLTASQKRSKNKWDTAFTNYLRTANPKFEGFSAEDRDLLKVMNTMSTTTGSQGGYLIPQGFSDMLEEAKLQYYCMAGVAEHFKTGTGNTMPWPTMNDTTNAGVILAQNTQVSEQDLVFGQVSFSAYILSSKLVLVPLALIEDSYFDLDALVAKNLGIRLGRGYNNYTTTGTGSSQPTGIVTAVANSGSGNIITAGGSTSSGETASVTYNDLVNLEHAVDPAYRQQSTWMFHDTFLKLLKKLVDDNGRPLWQPGLTASFINGASATEPGGDIKPKILDHSYVINQSMAQPGASNYTAIFGDLSTFKVRELVSGTEVIVMNERYADYLQRGFTAFQRFDSNYVNAGTNPIAIFQQSAS